MKNISLYKIALFILVVATFLLFSETESKPDNSNYVLPKRALNTTSSLSTGISLNRWFSKLSKGYHTKGYFNRQDQSFSNSIWNTLSNVSTTCII